jgi:PEGA domain
VAAAGAELRRAACCLGCAVGVLGAAPASGAEPADAAVRAARQLFVDAEHDEDGGRWSDALQKLRRVVEVKRTGGVAYHVALCEEHLGQLAAALDDYTAAQGLARDENAQDVLRLVGKRITDLAQRVPHVTIRVPADVPDARVTLDGAALPAAVLGTSIPVDPGDHRVEATAPGHSPASRVVTLREHDSTAVYLTLPPLVAPPAPPASPSPPPPDASASPSAPQNPVTAETPSAPRTAALLSTAGAVVLAAGGVGAYVLAGNAHASGKTSCAQVISTSPDACNSQKSAVHVWDFTAAGAWVAAAAVGAVAVVLWARPAPAAASASLLVGLGGVDLEGRF